MSSPDISCLFESAPSEDKANHFKQNVQTFINKLDENEAYRSRVLDVRNWFDFWANEKFRETQ